MRQRRALRWGLIAIAIFLMGPTWPRDDTGVPAPVCYWQRSTGQIVACSDLDPLPTGAGTTSGTDPTGWGKNWFAASGTNTGVAAAAFFTGDVTVQHVTANGTGTALDVRTSITGGRVFALTETGAGDTCATVNAGLRTTTGAFLIGCNADGVNDGLFHSGSGFETWTRENLPSVTGLGVQAFAQQGTTVLLWGTSGSLGFICRSTNSGASFASCTDFGAVTTGLRQGLASPTASVWLVKDADGTVARSTDDGASFAQVLTGLGQGGVKCLSATVCLVADGTNIRRSANAGATWTTVFTAPPGTTFRAFVDFGSGVVNAFETDSVYRSSDFGVTWQFQVALPSGFAISSTGVATTATSNGRGILASDFGGGLANVLYSPIVGAGETIIADARGNRQEINASGEAEVSAVIRDSTQTNAAAVTAGGRVTVVSIQEAGGQRTCSEPAANTAATITVTGVASQRIVLYDYIAFYTTAPAAAQTLTVTSAAVNVWLDIVNGANTPTQRSFSAGLLPTDGNTLTVTLPAAGAGVVGKLCATITGPFLR